MARAFVAVGSNVHPAENVQTALRRLAQQTVIRNVSTVYLTEPVERAEQPFYYNCVVEIETELAPSDLKSRILRGIEGVLNREREEDRYAARTIDLDLILYDDQVMDQADLTLPDPDIVNRPFLAIPLNELAPGLVLPGSRRCIAEVAASLSPNRMKALVDYTKELREDILHERKA